jgi:adenosylcobinamide kinase / adenosylcobinamide-phosphate guanylyltransferase
LLTFITGGARSGKSKFAQSLCRERARVVYLATAVSSDEEMRARIGKHRSSRPTAWHTVEEPLKVSEAAALHIESADILLIDCLTIWLSNLLYELRDEDFDVIERTAIDRVEALIDVSKSGNVIAVTNEVGSGIVPESLVGRNFRDLQGLVNQRVARGSDVVYFVVSGISMCIKGSGGPR